MCARPNAVVTVVALYDGPQTLPLPEMYGKNLTFKTGGVDGCKCAEILAPASRRASWTPRPSSPTRSRLRTSRPPMISSPTAGTG